MKYKWIRFFAVGGLGGISPTLLKFAFHPLIYFSEFTSTSHWLCWIAADIIFFMLGGVVAYIGEKRSLAKAFYLGISAPAIIFAIYSAGGWANEYDVKHEYKQIQANISASCVAIAAFGQDTYQNPYAGKEKQLSSAETKVEPNKSIEMTEDSTDVQTRKPITIEIESDEAIEIIVPPAILIRQIPEGPISFNMALAGHSMGSYSVPIKIILQNDTTITETATVNLYRKKHRKTIVDSYIDIRLREVEPGDYTFTVELISNDTLLTENIKMSFTKKEQVSVVCIVDMIDMKLYLHATKNLGGDELTAWIENLQKQHAKKPGLFRRIVENIFNFFF